MLQNQKVLFFGAGPMAEAIISGMIQSAIIPANQIYVQNRMNHDRLNELQAKYKINIFDENKNQLNDFNTIVLAVQPKHIEDVLGLLSSNVRSDQLILSIVTSITTEYFEANLKNQPVIRVMPNTSSMVSESATAMTVGQYVSEEQIDIAKMLLRSIGEVYLIPEKNMDIFTGIAGSGPAYFYYFMEQMEQVGVEGGLSEQQIRSIVAQTVLGAAKMVLAQQGSPATLRKNVAAPNGPTEAGLNALELYGGGSAIKEAVRSTTNRSIEMNQPFNIVGK
ncbi:pyrroline-5-carboxylate reductase [Heyndrickxia sp. NPDC080065]|uniref:pyrroline-5-carboxylate reductase n=1 Tax=Heyndrickxia sp. NPDC080065 TaxID=3390568 RepID=UPI003D002C87